MDDFEYKTNLKDILHTLLYHHIRLWNFNLQNLTLSFILMWLSSLKMFHLSIRFLRINFSICQWLKLKNWQLLLTFYRAILGQIFMWCIMYLRKGINWKIQNKKQNKFFKMFSFVPFVLLNTTDSTHFRKVLRCWEGASK